MANPVINTKKHQPAAHGGGVRGDNSAARSALFEGRFGRLFRSLPAAEWPKDALLELGRKMTSDPEVDERDPRLPLASPETDKRVQDDEENAGIPSGYTYLGQFIDHDITFDPASSLQQHNERKARANSKSWYRSLNDSVVLNEVSAAYSRILHHRTHRQLISIHMSV
jgi:hypothetical protein